MTNYIERYWRDAKPADATKEPPMVARFRDEHYQSWVIDNLIYWDRSEVPWHRDDGFCYERCQVYDAPDPGEGWRLVDTASEVPQDGDEVFANSDWHRLSIVQFGKAVYRRRITPTVAYVPFTWEDRDQLRGRWMKRIIDGDVAMEMLDTCFDCRTFTHFAKKYLEDWHFLDTGEPVGKKVTQ